MKKHSFWKSIGIIFAIIFMLSWLLPTGGLNSGTYTAGTVAPFGFLDLVRVPISILSNYINYGVYILVIGGFYGVLNYSGVYTPLVDKIVNSFKNNPLIFLVITVYFFAIGSALTSLSYLLFIFVPFFVTILVKLNYKKVSAIAATIGAILVGNFASLYGFTINGYLNYYLNLGVNENILIRIILLVLAVALLIGFLVWESGKNAASKVSEIKLYNKKDSKKKALPLIFMVVGMTIFIVIAGFNWRYITGITFFEDLYTDIGAIKLGNYAIINNIIGNTNPLGWWGISETVIILIFMSVVIGWIYGLKIKETFDSFVSGAKEMLKPALYVIAANVAVGMLTYAGYQSSETIYIYLSHTIINMSKTFNVFVVMLYTVVSSFFYNDLSTIIDKSLPELTTVVTTVKDYPIIAMIMQMFHAIIMFLLPTSLFLVGGLAYSEVSYIDWLKYIWKFVLGILGLAIFVVIILLLI